MLTVAVLPAFNMKPTLPLLHQPGDGGDSVGDCQQDLGNEEGRGAEHRETDVGSLEDDPNNWFT